MSYELNKTDLSPFPTDWLLEELHRRACAGFSMPAGLSMPVSFESDEKALLAEALRMLWQERLERMGKFREHNFQPAKVAELSKRVDSICAKLVIESL